MRLPVLLRIYKDGKLIDIKQFTQDQIVIGNGSEVGLSLADETVAPIHSIIEYRDGQYILSDLGSQAGTFLNGERVLEKILSQGDEIKISQYKIEFFEGAPVKKEKSAEAPVVDKPKESKELSPPPIIKESTSSKVVEEKPPIPPQKPVEVKEEVKEAVKEEVAPPVPVVKSEPKEESAPTPPEPVVPVPAEPQESNQDKVYYKNPVGADGVISGQSKNYSQKFGKKTFAPASQIKDPKLVLKPEKGTVVEVAVVWQERILSTHHFKKAGPVFIGTAKKCDIKIPLMGLNLESFQLLDIGQQAAVFFPGSAFGELYSEQMSCSLQDIVNSGAVLSQGGYHGYGLKQGEMIRMEIDSNGLCLFVRYVPDTPKPLALPFFDFSSREMLGVIFAVIMTLAIKFILSFYIPENLDDENLLDEPLRMAKIEFKKPKRTVVQPPPEKIPVKEKVEVKKEVKKERIKVAEKTNKDQKKAAPKKVAKKPPRKAGKTGAVANNNNKKSNKKIGSVQKGGSIKTGDKKGATAKVKKPKSVEKLGLLGAFGSGGTQKKVREAVSGAGDLFGAADEATGSSGYNEDRPGDNLGSKLGEVGAGGKGTNTVGAGGIKTKGKTTGFGGTGTGGLGSKSNVGINVSGGGAEFVGSIDKEAIRRVIRNNISSIRACYNTALKLNNNLTGKVVLSWDIEEKGRPSNVRIKYAKPSGMRTVAQCLKNRLLTWRFPEPPEGTVAEVSSYPFVFRN